MWGGNGRPQQSAHPAPRVPGAQRGEARPLIPRAPGPQDSGSASSSAAPGLGRPAGLGVASTSPRVSNPSHPCSHFTVGLASVHGPAPEVEDRLPQGPRGGWAGPVWLVLSVTRPRGPSDLRKHPGLCGPCGCRVSCRIHHPPGSAPSRLPPAQESQRCPEQAPCFTPGGIFSQFSLLTFSRAVSINGSVLIITGPGLGRLRSPN